jgi:hypothetical protein
MFPHTPPASAKYPLLGRPAPRGSAATRYFAPCRSFATLAALQQKKSASKPNSKTQQAYDLKGEHYETGTKSERQVAQHDGTRRLTPKLRLAPTRTLSQFSDTHCGEKKRVPNEPNSITG